jgi:hypothetical protein
MIRPTVSRVAGLAARQSIVRPVQARAAHAISNPTLANIEKRWEQMPPQEQADLWMALRDRMKGNWAELTLAEKKAGMCLVLASEAVGMFSRWMDTAPTTTYMMPTDLNAKE